MHNIVFAELSSLDNKVKKVSLTERVTKDNVFVGSRRSTYYKIIPKRQNMILDKVNLTPHIYIFKKIIGNKKFLKWRVNGFVRLSDSRSKTYYLAYEHSFWILIKSKV
jgi:hypothetical protein